MQRLKLRILLSITTILILVSVLILYSSSTPAENIKESSKKKVKKPEPIIDPVLQGFFDEFSKTLQSNFESKKLPGAAIAIVIDSAIYLKTIGKKSVNSTDSIDLNTPFRIASLSKGFSSILAGKILKEQGINWNSSVSAFMPDFKTTPVTYKNSVSLEHILSHTGGYPYQAYSTLIEDGIDRDQLIDALLNVEHSRKPGAIHSYQNVAYSLIEPILENIKDTSFQVLMKSELFEPLGMRTASITYDEMLKNENRAVPHLNTRKGYRPQKISFAYYNTAAAGGINASILDMSQWMKALLGKRTDVIPIDVLDSVFTPRIRTSVKNWPLSNFDRPRKGHYGLGWRIVEYPNDTLIYHGGYANGFKSEIALDRQKNIAICILTNSSSNYSNELVVKFFKAYKEFLGEQSPDSNSQNP